MGCWRKIQGMNELSDNQRASKIVGVPFFLGGSERLNEAIYVAFGGMTPQLAECTGYGSYTK